MILQNLCELAAREGLSENPDYQPLPVAWILAIGDEGQLLDVVPTSVAHGPKGKLRPKTLSVPRRAGRTSRPQADFLVDKSEYVLGVQSDDAQKKRSEQDLNQRRALFLAQVREARQTTGVPALAALERFLESEETRERTIQRLSASGFASNDLFAFELHGRLIHDLSEVRSYFSAVRRSATPEGLQCLVCGKRAPAVDKHPSVKIPGGTTSGIALVSFNSDAFESYGLSRNANAPVCRDCADAYTTALTRLLSERYPDPRQPGSTLPKRFLRLTSDTTAVYWADGEDTVLDLLTSYFESPRVESVGQLLKAPVAGVAPPAVSNRFYCMILSGGQGRAVLRGMHTGTVARLEEAMCDYFQSIDVGTESPLPLWRLLRSVALLGKQENLPPGLASDVFVSIMFERSYPQTLLARAVERCRAEQKVTPERAAILRSYLIRNLRLEVSVGLDRDSLRPGYRLGRLMAVLERIQAAAQRNLNKTVVDRYYGAASTRPATVFPRLIPLTQHHIAKLQEGQAIFFQRLLAEVLDGIAEFPRVLPLEEQGVFALGYYHQRQEFFRKSEGSKEIEETA